jgi:oxalate decarboxylase/phosphoglucose isomerase-like protein (cupin superfamily)
MINPIIINNDESDEYFFEEGCYILELSNSDKDPNTSIARARLAPNTKTKLHRLNKTIERYIILQGEGEVILGNSQMNLLTQHVKPNDVVIIPENYPQAISNIGKIDLIFLVICTPRFLEKNYSE